MSLLPVGSYLHAQIHLNLEKVLMLSHLFCNSVSHHVPLVLQLLNNHLEGKKQ